MLFRYLIGTIALAATVVTSPTEVSDFVKVQQANYLKFLTTVVEVKQPVAASCNAGKVEEVKYHLKKVYAPVAEISTKFIIYDSVSIRKSVILDHAARFIEVLKKLEEVLIVIHLHSKISAACSDVFVQLNLHFESISIEFKHHGVDIYKLIKESSLRLSVWTSLGLKFHSKHTVTFPNEITNFVTVQRDNYEKCLTTIVEIKKPVIASCNAGRVDEVKYHLNQVFTPVAEISNKFRLYDSFTIEKTAVSYHARKFIEVLKKLEQILVVIQVHAEISAGCTDVFVQLNVHFESISVEFNNHGVDIYKKIQESSLTFSVWTSLGFTFYSNHISDSL